jgi:hypothetical protein
MSYYDSPQWAGSNQQGSGNWEHQGATTPTRAGTPSAYIHRGFGNLADISGASAPQPQDDYAFSYQFDGMSAKQPRVP